KLGSHFLACSLLSVEILLQAVHVIDACTDLREGACIACVRPQTSQEVSGNKALYIIVSYFLPLRLYPIKRREDLLFEPFIFAVDMLLSLRFGGLFGLPFGSPDDVSV